MDSRLWNSLTIYGNVVFELYNFCSFRHACSLVQLLLAASCIVLKSLATGTVIF